MSEKILYPEPESSTIEWKEEAPLHKQIIKTVVGFCNQNGGKLVLGVKNDGVIKGLLEEKIERLMEELDQAIYQACTPPIIPRIYRQRFGEHSVLVIETSAGMNKPYYIRSEGQDKGTYVRIGRNTMHATPEMIQELKWQSQGITFESTLVYKASRGEIDDQKVRTFLVSRKNRGSSSVTDRILEAYHLIRFEHAKCYPTVAGILLFGKRPQHFFSEAMIICTHFKGTQGREAIGTIDCEGTLFEQFEQAIAFSVGRLARSFTIKGMKRYEVLEIPEIAIREALLNALIHRNYHQLAPIKISLFDDRIEILSPGTFPGPLDPTNLQSGITFLRNPLICRVFREANYVEKMGTGLVTIFKSYKQHGLPAPSITEDHAFVRCILPRGQMKAIRSLPENTKDIYEMICSGEKTLEDLMAAFSLSRSSAWRRLKKLIDSGLVIRIGRTRGAKYRTK